MNKNTIYNQIKKNIHKLDPSYEYYSILIPIIEINDILYLLFEIRSNNLRRQPGEISFPGGKKESGESFKETAIRETTEELNISRKKIEIIGSLSPISTHYNDLIYPFVGFLHNITIKNVNFNRSEVNNLFIIPISFFIENPPLKYYIETQPNPSKDFPYYLLPTGKNYKFLKGNYPVYFYKYKNYVIWGLTARIVKNFMDILEN
ncbi:NUDIX hydrolase [Garciella nitratireducens]|uniref:NUDIX hydrolase n=1 Tax=Garciella nitratireducens TaxID=218205 RepID=UPI001BD6664B|nr:CoA pyrophosphatase [Garciella nitratireducens]